LFFSFNNFFTSSSLFLNTLGKEVNNTIVVIIPATKSAIPSDKYTPLNPIKWVKMKHKGIKMITFLKTAKNKADFA